MSTTTPDWQLLPHDPLAFFQLAEGFDRKALKRSYGKLIRVYKPETHPAEFQRIRAAYERLESQDRYGVQQALSAGQTSAWEDAFERRPSAGGKGQVSTSQPAEFQAVAMRPLTAAIEDPAASYRQLADKRSRSPQEYFMLATLSDVVDRKSANMYLKWLLTGIREHPQDPGLLRLLTEYLSAFGDAKIAASALLSISRLISGDDYYRVTERLWNRLLDRVPFEGFAKTLAACERNLHFSSLRPQLAFYARLLRKAMWTAPAQWTADRLQFLEQHGSELDAALDEDVEFLLLLRDYRDRERDALLRRPVGAIVDQLIQKYCQDDSLAGVGQVAMLCDQLARNGHGVCETFPTTGQDGGGRGLLLCAMIAAEVAMETGLDFGKSNADRLRQQADATVADLRNSILSAASRITWMRYRLYGIPYAVLVFAPILLSYGLPYWLLWATLWGVLATLAFFAILRPLWLDKKADLQCLQLLSREYEARWRPRLVRYVQACHAPADLSIERLLVSGRELGQSQVVEIALAYAQGDRGLQLLSQLQLFVY